MPERSQLILQQESSMQPWYKRKLFESEYVISDFLVCKSVEFKPERSNLAWKQILDETIQQVGLWSSVFL